MVFSPTSQPARAPRVATWPGGRGTGWKRAGPWAPQASSPGDADEGGADDAPTGGIAIATEEAKPATKRPAMFKVLLLNDDYTPMEFVVHVLEAFFAMEREKAVQIMLAVHTTGSAVVGIYPRDIAETKSEQVNHYARENDHPLLSKVEITD